MLQRHYDPTDGSICLDDTDLREIDAGWYRKQLGVVSQDPRLFTETISENIAYGSEGLSQVSCTLPGHHQITLSCTVESCSHALALLFA